jgi:hypothetical protein
MQMFKPLINKYHSISEHFRTDPAAQKVASAAAIRLARLNWPGMYTDELTEPMRSL